MFRAVALGLVGWIVGTVTFMFAAQPSTRGRHSDCPMSAC